MNFQFIVFEFEEYYLSIEKAKRKIPENMILNSINACISFSEFMQNVYSKDFKDIDKMYQDKLFLTN